MNEQFSPAGLASQVLRQEVQLLKIFKMKRDFSLNGLEILK